VRGIELLRPRYAPGLLHPADVATWEALHEDGTVLREREGAVYRQIDRSQLSAFRIVQAGELLLEMLPPAGATGRNLVYRRRTTLGSGGRDVLFVVGWVPMGPAVTLNLRAGTFRTLETFTPGDPELDPPDLHPWEGEIG
jgi:hypothetical protein